MFDFEDFLATMAIEDAHEEYEREQEEAKADDNEDEE